MGNGEQLKEVEEGKIPEVLEELKGDENWPFSFMIHQMIKMMQEFKKNNYTTFKQKLLMIGDQIVGGTFILLTSFKGNSGGITYVDVYSGGDEAPDVAAALQDPAVPWATDQLIFDVVYGGVRPHVLQTLKAKGTPYTEATLNLFWISPDEEHKLEERTPPSDVTLMFLNEGHAKEINEKWSQKFLDSENVIKDCILTSFGMGVVRKSDRKLLSHVLCNHAGAMFILWTEPEERRKGYASLVVGGVVRESTKRQRTPCAVLGNGNPAAEALFNKYHLAPLIPAKYYAVTKT